VRPDALSFNAVLKGALSGEHLQATLDILCDRQQQSMHITSSIFPLLFARAADQEAHTVVLQGWAMMRAAGVKPTAACTKAHLAALVALVRFMRSLTFPRPAVSATSCGAARA
jgi:hypothetical protein